jgi:hypothetical protein
MYMVTKGTIEDLRNDPMMTSFYLIPKGKEDDAVRFEIWGTSFNDAGGDYTQLRLFNAKDEQIFSTECSGY